MVYMTVVNIVAAHEDGVLQRTVFEFSRRNIEIGRLAYSHEEGLSRIRVTLSCEEEAAKVVKSLKKIYGVFSVEYSAAEEREDSIAGRAAYFTDTTQ